MTDLSIIIPTFNCADYLDLCLRSIVDTTPTEAWKDMEVIVILDGCTDTSYKVVENYSKDFPNIKGFGYEGNKGVSFATNLGVWQANGHFIFLVNDDMVFPQNWIQMFKLLERIPIVCPQLIEPGIIPVSSDLIEKDFGHDYESFEIESFWNYESEHKEDKLIPGKNHPLMMPRTFYLALGGHDENMTHADVDFYHKAMVLGIPIFKTYFHSFYHFSGKSMQNNFTEEQKNQRTKNNYNYYKRKWRI